MYQNTGFFLLFFCTITSLYGALAATVAGLKSDRKLFVSAKRAASLATIGCVGAALLLWIMLFARDYTVGYIFRNSSNDLPALYTLSAFWSALEGSHFLWTLLLAVFSFIAHQTYSEDNEHIMPYVSATLQVILAWMFFLAITDSDPFAPTQGQPPDGLGMNALLQNPYMTFHPPSLFIGYTTLAIPYAYAIAALAYGDITSGWLRTVRRWSLVSFVFLTIGVFLGGRWAYVELGWAGYWAWDPVENSSFMPWLFNVSLLHSLIVQEKIGHLKRTSIILAALSFFFSYFGTFITRSGIISSVHSFAQSPIGPHYLAFLIGIFLLTGILYVVRSPAILPSNVQKVWGFSKESALVVTQFLLMSFAIVIFVGTVYPIVSEALTGSRFNVQAPYFNSFAPYIGFAIVLAVALGNLMRFEGKHLIGGKVVHGFALVFSAIATTLFAYAGDFHISTGWRFAVQLFGTALVFWSMACLAYDCFERLKTLRFQVRLIVKSNLSYLGAFLAHCGVMIAILGFLGNLRGLDQTVTLKSGESTELFGYQFLFEGISVEKQNNVTLFSAPLKIIKDNQTLGVLSPARAKYPTSPELFHEVGLDSHFWHDLYAVLADFDKQTGKEATLQIHINPTVKLVWISAFFMVLGGLLCLFDRLRGRYSKDHLFASGGTA